MLQDYHTKYRYFIISKARIQISERGITIFGQMTIQILCVEGQLHPPPFSYATGQVWVNNQ